MKKVLFAFAIVTLFFTGCDIIDDPVIPFTGNYDIGLYGEPPTFGNAPTILRNVLLEDFTAHQCGNCPSAAITAEEIVEQNEGRVVVLAIHSGSLAEFNDEDPFATDWTTPASDLYFSQLDFQANPLGRVNRAPAIGNILSPAEWEDLTEAALTETAVVNLQMEVDYVAENEHLNIHVNGQFPSAYSPQLKLVVLITESHIIDYQLDYDSDPEIVPDYEFNHVLRGDVNGPEGLDFSSGASAGDAIQNNYTFDWNADWNVDNCNVVAFLYTNSTGEVMNAIEKHIIP